MLISPSTIQTLSPKFSILLLSSWSKMYPVGIAMVKIIGPDTLKSLLQSHLKIENIYFVISFDICNDYNAGKWFNWPLTR